MYDHQVKQSLYTDIQETVDLYLIITKLCQDVLNSKLDKMSLKQISQAIFNLIGSLSCSLSNQFNVLKRKSVSIRDILYLIEFINVNLDKMQSQDISQCFSHAAELVIMDGICLGIDTGGKKEQDAITDACRCLIRQIQIDIFKTPKQIATDTGDFVNTSSEIGVGEFRLAKIVNK